MLTLGKGFSVCIFLILLTGCTKPCSPVGFTNQTCFWQLKVIDDKDTQTSGKTVARLPAPQELLALAKEKDDENRLKKLADRIRDKYGDNADKYPKYVFYVSEESKRLIKKDKIYIFTNPDGSPILEVFAEDYGRQ
jgi:hypothetical protein